MDTTLVDELRRFVQHCRSNPAVLYHPALEFFKEYIEKLGGHIPPGEKAHTMDQTGTSGAKDQVEDEIVESDIELDEVILEPDNDPPQQMGDPSVEVTEESRDAAQVSKGKAMDALSEGKLEEAIHHLTEAIMSNPCSAILYASRASTFLKMNKPNAAIRDAEAALQINPDSAKGYKSRGLARAMLGQWVDAAKDLHLASKLDYDDEIASALKKVKPNAHKIEEHQRKYERLRKEKGTKKTGKGMQSQRSGAEDPESLAALREGKVISVHSPGELQTKLQASTNLSRLVVLYFTAVWCGPCRFMGPVFTSLAEKYPKVIFLKLDIDELGSVAQQWNVSSVPTFFFLRDGKEVDKVVGADKSGLERKLASYTGKP